MVLSTKYFISRFLNYPPNSRSEYDELVIHMKGHIHIRTMEGQPHELCALLRNKSPPRNVFIPYFKKENSRSFPHFKKAIQEQQESLSPHFGQPRRFRYVLRSYWSWLVFSIRQRKEQGLRDREGLCWCQGWSCRTPIHFCFQFLCFEVLLP